MLPSSKKHIDATAPHQRPIFVASVVGSLVLGAVLIAPSASATPLAFTTTGFDVQLPGHPDIDADQIVVVDHVLGTSGIAFDAGLFASGSPNIDALDFRDDGSLIFSVSNADKVFPDIGPSAVDDSDLLHFDGTSISLFHSFNPSFIEVGADIDALSVVSDDVILFSLGDGATVGSNALMVQSDAIVEYNLATNIASLFFDGSSIFSGMVDINAFSLLDDGSLLLSHNHNDGRTTLDGIFVRDEDLLLWNPNDPTGSPSGTSTLLFDGSARFSNFSDASTAFDIRGVDFTDARIFAPQQVPLPGALALIGLGFLLLRARP